MKENLGKAVRKLSRSVATLDLRENPKSTVCTWWSNFFSLTNIDDHRWGSEQRKCKIRKFLVYSGSIVWPRIDEVYTTLRLLYQSVSHFLCSTFGQRWLGFPDWHNSCILMQRFFQAWPHAAANRWRSVLPAHWRTRLKEAPSSFRAARDVMLSASHLATTALLHHSPLSL